MLVSGERVIWEIDAVNGRSWTGTIEEDDFEHKFKKI